LCDRRLWRLRSGGESESDGDGGDRQGCGAGLCDGRGRADASGVAVGLGLTVALRTADSVPLWTSVAVGDGLSELDRLWTFVRLIERDGSADRVIERIQWNQMAFSPRSPISDRLQTPDMLQSTSSDSQSVDGGFILFLAHMRNPATMMDRRNGTKAKTLSTLY
jgi:hypothetical protein